MNKLALVRRLARECRMTASSTVPSTTISQTGNLLDAVTWLDDAWNELQLSNYWQWMRSRFTLNTVASDHTYAYGDCNDETTGTPITRFREWLVNDPIDPVTIYLQSSGVGTQGYVWYMPWELFRMNYRIGTVIESVPCHITVDPQQNIVLGPTPNDIYVVAGGYWKSPQEMTLDADIPELPTYYHLLLVYQAMMKYAGSESAAEIMARALREGGPLRNQLQHDQGRRMRFARAMV